MARHTDADRLNIPVPSSRSYERGKFGRMFPTLPPCLDNSPESLSGLSEIAEAMVFSEKMINDAILSKILGDSDTPAGYTYLGQFLIHDLSFDLTSISERLIDPEYLWNFRTPALDLDSVYGSGPVLNPYFYERHKDYTGFWLPERKRVGDMDPDFYDLPRTGSSDRTAVIADLRNDENIIIAQIHSLFLQLHNALSRQYSSKNVSEPERNRLFKAVQQEIKWTYQWLILYDFLPRVIDMNAWNSEDIQKALNMEDDESDVVQETKLKHTQKLIKAIATGKIARKHYEWRNEPFIPLEFSAAAFRFGHSQVRDVYQFNKDLSSDENNDPNDPRYPPKPLFDPLRTTPPRVDLKLFFPGDEKNSVRNKLIGPRLSPTLTQLPAHALQPVSKDLDLQTSADPAMRMAQPNKANLALINLKRGMMLNLPGGQSVARAMSLPSLEIQYPHFPDRFRANTPLWYYILYESAFQNQGKRLGAAGSVIVAEVIIGLLQGDKTSFLNQHPRWIPLDETGKPNSNFRMANVIKKLEALNQQFEIS